MRHIIMTGLLLMVIGTAASPLDATATQDQTSNERTSSSTDRVDLNTADRAALEALPGIGPRTAELIIEYRDEAGGFKKVEELMNIRGIGERTFLRLRELVQIGNESSER